MQIKQVFDDVFSKKFKRHQDIGVFLHKSRLINSIIGRASDAVLSIKNDVVRRNKLIAFAKMRNAGGGRLCMDT
jgi:hypothetical protein